MLKPEKFDPLRRSVGHVLDIIGEGWSILIIREAFLGTRRFEEFQKRLGIARNILTARLKNLCANESWTASRSRKAPKGMNTFSPPRART